MRLAASARLALAEAAASLRLPRAALAASPKLRSAWSRAAPALDEALLASFKAGFRLLSGMKVSGSRLGSCGGGQREAAPAQRNAEATSSIVASRLELHHRGSSEDCERDHGVAFIDLARSANPVYVRIMDDAGGSLADDQEARRLRALDALRAFGGNPADPRFDRIVRLASRLFGAPRAAIRLIGKDRVWLKAKVGFDHVEEPRPAGLSERMRESGVVA